MSKKSAEIGRCAPQTSDRRTDVVAIGVFAVIAVWLFYSVRYGVQTADEAYYYAITHRLVLGDRLIVNEWNPTQFAAVFQYIPFKLYYTITGGTEGVILAMRYVYVGIKLVFFWYVYVSMRKFGALWALIAAVLFTGYNVYNMVTLSYYDIGIMTALVLGMILFVRHDTYKIEYVFAGFMLACTVIVQPMIALLYFIFTVVVLIKRILDKKKKLFLPAYAFLFNARVWGYMTVGVVICAAIFCGVLFHGLDFETIRQNLPEMFSSQIGASRLIQPDRIFRYALSAGYISCALQAAYFIFLAAQRRRLRQRRLLYFAIGCAVFIFAIVDAFYKTSRLLYSNEYLEPYQFDFNMAIGVYKPVIFSLFGIVCYALTEQKDKKMFAFLVFGFLLAFLIDRSSSASIAVGNVVSNVPAVILLRNLLAELWHDMAGNKNFSRRELRQYVRPPEKNSKKKTNRYNLMNRICADCLAALIAVSCVSEIYYYSFTRTWNVYEQSYLHLEKSPDRQLRSGPLKGLKTVPEIPEKYDDAMRDINRMLHAGATCLFVADVCPWYYLYADCRYGCYCPWYLETEVREKSERYWRVHPDARPDFIYVPLFNYETFEEKEDAAQEKLEYIQSKCACEITRARVGYIVKVLSWNDAGADIQG